MIEGRADECHIDAGGAALRGPIAGKIVGVDGCRSGWLAVSRRPLAGVDSAGSVQQPATEQLSLQSSGYIVSLSMYADIHSLWRDHQDAACMLVDMPIGLPDASPRLVEPAARRRLPGRAASVFSVPCREAVFASSYAQACDINQARLGKRLSLQSWYICPKIRELDELLQSSHQAANVICEAHPELAFASLRGAPLQYTKKLAAGHRERLEILAQYSSDMAALYAMGLQRWRRSQVQADDILDAMALLITLTGIHQTLLTTSSIDGAGLEINLILPARYSSSG